LRVSPPPPSLKNRLEKRGSLRALRYEPRSHSRTIRRKLQ
jgi:hypothetical protein